MAALTTLNITEKNANNSLSVTVKVNVTKEGVFTTTLSKEDVDKIHSYGIKLPTNRLGNEGYFNSIALSDLESQIREEKEERMNYFTIHKCKNEDERKELKELCDWYFKDTPVLTMSFSLTEEDLRVTMERDVELSAVAGAVKNQHHKKKI